MERIVTSNVLAAVIVALASQSAIDPVRLAQTLQAESENEGMSPAEAATLRWLKLAAQAAAADRERRSRQ